MNKSMDTFYEVMRRQGVSRCSFLKYCSRVGSGASKAAEQLKDKV